MMTRLLQISAFLLASACVVHGGRAPVTVDIRENSVVAEDMVLLGDLADIRGDRETADRLRKASLGYAPSIGTVRTISLRKIELVIAAAGIPQHAFIMRAPAVVYVRREGQPVPREMIKEQIEVSLDRLLLDKSAEYQITRLDIPDANEVPLGKLEIGTVFSKIRNLFEPFSLPIEIRVNSRLISKIAARVEIEVFAEVLAAAADIPANTRISKDQLVPIRTRISRPLTEYLVPESRIKGIKSSQEIRKGDPLTKSVYLADIVVKTGDRVRIIGVSNRIRLTVNGVAQASGRIGDRVAVKNLQSNRILQGTITDEGIVEVIF